MTQKSALTVVVELGGRNLYAREPLAAAGLAASTMSGAVQGLVHKQVLRREPEGSDVLVRFEDRFFSR